VTTYPWPLRSSLELGALSSAVPCACLHVKHVLWEWGAEFPGRAAASWPRTLPCPAGCRAPGRSHRPRSWPTSTSCAASGIISAT